MEGDSTNLEAEASETFTLFSQLRGAMGTQEKEKHVVDREVTRLPGLSLPRAGPWDHWSRRALKRALAPRAQ